jgi:hypothetical protein
MPSFEQPQQFLQSSLPNLVPDGPAFTLVAITHGVIGFSRPIHHTKIERPGDGLVAIKIERLDPDAIRQTIPDLLKAYLNPKVPALLTVYGGWRHLVAMLEIVGMVRQVHPSIQTVLLTCDCISDDEQALLEILLDNGTLRHVVWVACGGAKAMGLIVDAVRNDWIGLPALPAADESVGTASSLDA